MNEVNRNTYLPRSFTRFQPISRSSAKTAHTMSATHSIYESRRCSLKLTPPSFKVRARCFASGGPTDYLAQKRWPFVESVATLHSAA